MSWIEALILGIIQGLTEFLPVSSSGHLEMARVLLGGDSLPEENLAFTVLLHAATALGTIIVFRKDIWSIIKGALSSQGKKQQQYILFIVISMLPAAAVGVLWNDLITSLFTGNLLLVGVSLWVTALLLWFAQTAKITTGELQLKDAIIIGVAQAIAILPGISRSGATIGTSLILGVKREEAARFSFLMVIPLIFGKMAKDALDFMGGDAPQLPNVGIMAVGFLAAMVVGILACQWMIKLVKNSKLTWFAIYCAAAGVFCMIYTFV